MMERVKGNYGKFKAWGVIIASPLYPAINHPPDSKQQKVKLLLRVALIDAWERGVGDGCLVICSVYVLIMSQICSRHAFAHVVM